MPDAWFIHPSNDFLWNYENWMSLVSHVCMTYACESRTWSLQASSKTPVEAFLDDDNLDIKATKGYDKELNNLVKAIEVYQAGLDEVLEECQGCQTYYSSWSFYST